MLAHPIPNRGGNAFVHDHHLYTREDHIAAGDFSELDLKSRKWKVLLYGSIAAMIILLVLMIARG